VLLMIFYSVLRKKFTALYTLFTSIIFNLIFKYISSRPDTLFIPTTGPSMLLQVLSSMGFFFKSAWALAVITMIFRPVSWVSTLSALLFGIGIGILVIRGSRKIKEGAQEVRRKTFHTVAALVVGITAIAVGRTAAIVLDLAGLVAALSFPLFERIPLIREAAEGMLRKNERSGETLFKFFIGILLPLLLNQPWIVLVIAVGDGMAALVGRFFGKTKIYKGKSLEGSLSGFLGAWAVSNQFYPHPLLAAVIYTLTELFTPLDDNLVIPIVLSLLFVPWTAIWNAIIHFLGIL